MATKYSRVFDDCLLPVCAWTGYFAWESILVRALSIYFGKESNTLFFLYKFSFIYFFERGLRYMVVYWYWWKSGAWFSYLWALLFVVFQLTSQNGTSGSWFWGHSLLECVFNLILFSLKVIFFYLTLFVV